MGERRHFREIGKDIFAYGFMSALSQVSGLLLLPLFTRIFSVDEYGVIDIFATFVSILTTVAQLSLPSAISRYFNDTSGVQEQKQLISTSLAFVAGVGLLILFGLSLFKNALAHNLLGGEQYAALVQYGCWIALLRSLSSIPMRILRLERKIIVFNLIGVSSTILYLLSALYLVIGQKSGIVGVFIAQVVAAAVSLLISLGLARKYLTLRLSSNQLKRVLKYSLPLFPAVFVSWANSQTDRLLILLIVGLGSVAIFGAAAKIAKIITFLVLVFRQAWQPYSVLIIKSLERDAVYRRMLNYYAGIFASLGLVFTAVSPELFALIVPEEYYYGYIVIPWLIGSIILHQSASLTNLGMIASEKTSGISIASWIGVSLNLIIALSLIRTFGVAGAAIGSFIAELVFTGLSWRFTVQKSSIRFNTKIIVIVLLSYIFGSILLIAISKVVISPMSIVYRVISSLVFVGLIAYQTIDEPVLRFLKTIPKRLELLFKRSRAS